MVVVVIGKENESERTMPKVYVYFITELDEETPVVKKGPFTSVYMREFKLFAFPGPDVIAIFDSDERAWKVDQWLCVGFQVMDHDAEDIRAA
jgi:hypothetical protein